MTMVVDAFNRQDTVNVCITFSLISHEVPENNNAWSIQLAGNPDMCIVLPTVADDLLSMLLVPPAMDIFNGACSLLPFAYAEDMNLRSTVVLAGFESLMFPFCSVSQSTARLHMKCYKSFSHTTR